MKIVALILVVAALALSLAMYSRLPARIPIHWNAAGEIDRYEAKRTGAFAMPAVMAALALVFIALPVLSPKGFDIERTSRAYAMITIAVLLFALGVHVFVLLAALNLASPITAIPLLIGGLLVILGNYLPKMRRNFFIGIRTPWTLADEDVWYRTHRLGGVVFVACGALLMTIGPFLHGRVLESFMIGLLVAAALISVIYSFAIYRRDGAQS